MITNDIGNMVLSNIRNGITEEELKSLISSGEEVIKNLIYTGGNHDSIFSGYEFNHIKFLNCSFRYISFSHSKFERCQFIDCDIPHTSFVNSNFNKCEFKNCNLMKAKFGGVCFVDCNLGYLDMCYSDIRKSSISGSKFNNVNLLHSNFTGSNISNVYFKISNLKHVCFHSVKFQNVDFLSSNLQHTNFSRSTGLINPIDYLHENFKWNYHTGGMVVYKLFDYIHSSVWPGKYIKKPGDIITEEPNYDRTLPCACGVNVANRKWFQAQKKKGDIDTSLVLDFWECLIKFEWLSGVVVPYNVDEQIRCCKIMLVRNLDYKEISNFLNEEGDV